MPKTRTPKWTSDQAKLRGADAIGLGETHWEQLGQRLPEGSLENLKKDYELLCAAPAEKASSVTERKGSTGEERSIAEDGHDLVMTIRNAARRTRGLTKGVTKALGVGEKLSPAVTSDVVGAVFSCLATFAKYPDLPGRLGVTQDDIDDGLRLIQDLPGADKLQGQLVVAGKQQTFDRNAVQLRVEEAVDLISSRGILAFRKDQAVRARFEALVSDVTPAAPVLAAVVDPTVKTKPRTRKAPKAKTPVAPAEPDEPDTVEEPVEES